MGDDWNFAYSVVAISNTEGSDGLPLGNVRFFSPWNTFAEANEIYWNIIYQDGFIGHEGPEGVC